MPNTKHHSLQIIELFDSYSLLVNLIVDEDIKKYILRAKEVISLLILSDDEIKHRLYDPEYDIVFDSGSDRMNAEPVIIISDLNQKIAEHFNLGEKIDWINNIKN